MNTSSKFSYSIVIGDTQNWYCFSRLPYREILCQVSRTYPAISRIIPDFNQLVILISSSRSRKLSTSCRFALLTCHYTNQNGCLANWEVWDFRRAQFDSSQLMPQAAASVAMIELQRRHHCHSKFQFDRNSIAMKKGSWGDNGNGAINMSGAGKHDLRKAQKRSDDVEQ